MREREKSSGFAMTISSTFISLNLLSNVDMDLPLEVKIIVYDLVSLLPSFNTVLYPVK